MKAESRNQGTVGGDPVRGLETVEVAAPGLCRIAPGKRSKSLRFLPGNEGFSGKNEGFSAGNEGFLPKNEGFFLGNEGFSTGNEGFSGKDEGFSPGNEGFFGGIESFLPGNEGVFSGNEGVSGKNEGFPRRCRGAVVENPAEKERAPRGGVETRRSERGGVPQHRAPPRQGCAMDAGLRNFEGNGEIFLKNLRRRAR